MKPLPGSATASVSIAFGDVDGDRIADSQERLDITISPRYEATPEPSGGAMLALGFAALALRRRPWRRIRSG